MILKKPITNKQTKSDSVHGISFCFLLWDTKVNVYCYFCSGQKKVFFYISDLHGKGFDLFLELVTKRDNHMIEKLIHSQKDGLDLFYFSFLLLYLLSLTVIDLEYLLYVQ